MSVSARVHFGMPQSELATTIRNLAQQCLSMSVVVGFATPEGVRAALDPVKAAPTKLDMLVVGACTAKGLDALEQLLQAGVSQDRLRMHLGHTRPKGATSAQKYHPMLHSKIYYFELASGQACAIVGSHNMTGFALLGQNGEAAVRLDGDSADPEFVRVREHIAEAARQAIPFDPSMKAALAWWTVESIMGLRRKILGDPGGLESKSTLVLMAQCPQATPPRKGQVVYFEMPEALYFKTLANEVHLYLFEVLPPTPQDALKSLDQAHTALRCFTTGLEQEKGGRELQADWEIVNRVAPQLSRTSKPFRPKPANDMRQVRVKVSKSAPKAYEYLFGHVKEKWVPQYSEEELHPPRVAAELHADALDVPQEEQGPWRLVKGLQRVDEPYRKKFMEALHASSPESGSYLLLSQKRRDLSVNGVEVDEEDS